MPMDLISSYQKGAPRTLTCRQKHASPTMMPLDVPPLPLALSFPSLAFRLSRLVPSGPQRRKENLHIGGGGPRWRCAAASGRRRGCGSCRDRGSSRAVTDAVESNRGRRRRRRRRSRRKSTEYCAPQPHSNIGSRRVDAERAITSSGALRARRKTRLW
jgi:hypothetical protein